MFETWEYDKVNGTWRLVWVRTLDQVPFDYWAMAVGEVRKGADGANHRYETWQVG